MALTYVGGTSGAGTGATYNVSLSGTLTGGSDSSPSAGDIVVVFSGFGNTASSAPTCSGNTSGAYQNATAAQHINDTWDTEFRSFWQKMGSTPDTTLTIGRVNNAAYGGATVVQVWRGANQTTPLVGAATPASAGNAGIVNPPAYNPAVTDSIIIAGGGGTLSTTGTAYGTLSGMSNTIALKSDGTTSDFYTVMASYAYAGVSYDPAAATGGSGSGTSSSWAGVTLALRPAIDHTNTGALTGPGATVAGTAAHNIPHPASGALTGPGAAIVGTAARTRAHPTTGVLTGPGAAIVGTAARTRAHPTTGALTGPGAALAGSADRQDAPAGVIHDTSGALAGQGAAVAGTSARTRQHATTGTLTGQGASVAGTASRTRQHATTGALAGQGAQIAGASARTRQHASSGTLTGPGAAIVGSSARTRAHPTNGALAGAGAVLAGNTARTRQHAASGVLAGQGAALAADAARVGSPVSHATTGVLVGPGATLLASASLTPLLPASGGASGSATPYLWVAAAPQLLRLRGTSASTSPDRARLRLGQPLAAMRGLSRSRAIDHARLQRRLCLVAIEQPTVHAPSPAGRMRLQLTPHWHAQQRANAQRLFLRL